MSGPFTTADDGDRFVVTVAAVYARGAEIATVAQRRAALRGFVSGTFRLDALEEAVLAGLPEGTRIHVRDGDAMVIGDAAPDDPGGGHDRRRRAALERRGVGCGRALRRAAGRRGRPPACCWPSSSRSCSWSRQDGSGTCGTSSPGCGCATT